MVKHEESGMRRAIAVSATALFAGALLADVASAGNGGGAATATALSTTGVVAFTGNSANPGVWLCGPDGSAVRRITPSGETWFADDVSRGPTGAPVTVVAGNAGRTQLFALRADGTGSPVLLYEAASPARVHTGRFSPDGARIAFIGNTGAVPVVFTIYVGDVVRSTAGEVTGLANVASAYDTSTQLARGLDFTRTGTQIVFAMANDLWRLDIASLGVTRLTSSTDSEAYPRCSPTDDRVAYERWPSATSMGQNGVICTIDVTTGAVTTVTTKSNGGIAAAYLSYPCWSPDASVLLYHAHDSSKSDLWQLSSVGSGKAVKVTNTPTFAELYPAWGW